MYNSAIAANNQLTAVVVGIFFFFK